MTNATPQTTPPPQTAETKRKGRRNAVLIAAALEVQCPHCGEPQPSPDNGSFMWQPSQITTQRLTCVACDESFRLYPQSRVSVIQ